MTHRSKACVWIGAATSLIAPAAFAHHPMGGQMPSSFTEGLLSGLGHPLIEPAHALFLVGAAVLIAASRMPLHKALALLVLHVLASTSGSLMTALPGIASAIPWILAASLIVLAPALWARRVPAEPFAWAFAAAAGLAHGLAFGEAVIGAETTPVLAYLGGLAVMQSCALTGLCLLVRQAMRSAPALITPGTRVFAGGMLAGGVGVALGVI
jgi:urease accessory protein